MIRFRTSLAEARVVPWANGRGVTRELVRREDAAGRLLLRLSVADVVEPGPFSKLPGLDRVLTLIDGPGFTLSIDGREVAVLPLEPVCFSGDAEVSATRVAVASRDFNVMSPTGAGLRVVVRRGGFRAEGGVRWLFVVEGRFEVMGEVVEAGGLVEVDGEAVVEGRGRLLEVVI